jgi:hypothetical protein
LLADAVAGWLLPSLVCGFVLRFLFMDVAGWGNMT